MSSHSLHPSIQAFGLADGCPRCEEQAGMPFETLDDENLANLVARTRGWMDDDPDSVARSRNEQRAMSIVETALVHGRVIARIEQEAAA